jgi:hypothetical protein
MVCLTERRRSEKPGFPATGAIGEQRVFPKLVSSDKIRFISVGINEAAARMPTQTPPQRCILNPE